MDTVDTVDIDDQARRGSSTSRRAAFLATFSVEEDKTIRHRVDQRFLLLAGVMYLVKNVST